MADETNTNSNGETPEHGANEAAPPLTPEERAAQLELELAETKDMMLRALAEQDNIRRRAERAAEDAKAYAIDRFARDLLAVADNLGRALSAVPEDQRAMAEIATLMEGVEMTEKALLETFAKHGVRRVGDKGDKFDPNIHQAVAQIPSDAPAGAIADVFQPGYVLAERTLRAAMVAISLGQPSAPPASGEDDPPLAPGIDIRV